MGFENDKLNRKKYADFLTEIISNPEKYKRISDSNAMSIAIDSGWGTGKTTFVNMWKEELENEVDENDNKKFAVIKYNAWKNDFAEEPLESLIYTLINHEIFNNENEINSGIQAGKDLLKYGGKLVSGLIKTGTRLVAGEDMADIAGEAVESLLENGTEGVRELFKDVTESDPEYKNFYSRYENYYSVINKIKESLENVASERKIIIIIDELDRCKPLFAIKLLENIKHILDAKNVCFVFALDMEQLSHSIKCIYGQGMDAEGYLCRFFDYISKMPKPDVALYIQKLIETRPGIRNSFYSFSSSGNVSQIALVDIFKDFSLNFNLSLRDIETIYSNFLILEGIQLKNTECYRAYSLYLFLLIIKYKRADLFNKIFIKNNFQINSDEIINKYERTEFFSKNVITEICENKKLSETFFNFKNTLDARNGKILNVEENIIVMLSQGYRYRMTKDSQMSISDYLFIDDLNKWDEIKEKTALLYIQENLEFFDFENSVESTE